MKPQGWLTPLSIPYGAAVRLRNRLYDIDVLEVRKIDAPVISVGNIAAGGTGKTPFVIYLSQLIKDLNLNRPGRNVILSRGYKGASSGTHVVSNGKQVLSTPDAAGDEPFMMAEKRRSDIVITDKLRVRGAKYALENFKVGQILLDDGFQHRRIHRDLDIVLLDAENPLGNRRLLPAGFLREPVKSLSRADIVVLSKAIGDDENLKKRAEGLSDLLKKPVIATRLKPLYWRRLGVGEILGAEEIGGRKVLAFAGIANPGSFFKLIEGFGGDMVSKIDLPDHCKYGSKVVNHISRQFAQNKAEWLVTTLKDSVKLPDILKMLPLYFLDTEVEVVVGEEMLVEKLKSVIKKGN